MSARSEDRSAQSLRPRPVFSKRLGLDALDAVRFYEKRFGLVLTPREESDLFAFLSVL